MWGYFCVSYLSKLKEKRAFLFPERKESMKMPLMASPWSGVSVWFSYQKWVRNCPSHQKKLLKPLGVSNASCLWMPNFSLLCSHRDAISHECPSRVCSVVLTGTVWCQPSSWLLPSGRAILPGRVMPGNEAAPWEPCHGHPTACPCPSQCQALLLRSGKA